MTKKQTLTSLAAVSLLLLSMISTAAAQVPTSAVRGNITDHFGGLVPRAEVIISNAHGLVQKAEGGDDGEFEIANVASGHYTVTIAAKGLRPALENDCFIASGKVTVENFVLEIADDAVEQVNANE